MPEMSIRVILKSGSEFTIKCTEFTLEKNRLGEVVSYNIQGITENKPIWIDWTQVAAIVRLVSDEGGEGND